MMKMIVIIFIMNKSQETTGFLAGRQKLTSAEARKVMVDLMLCTGKSS